MVCSNNKKHIYRVKQQHEITPHICCLPADNLFSYEGLYSRGKNNIPLLGVTNLDFFFKVNFEYGENNTTKGWLAEARGRNTNMS